MNVVSGLMISKVPPRMNIIENPSHHTLRECQQRTIFENGRFNRYFPVSPILYRHLHRFIDYSELHYEVTNADIN